MLSITLLFSFSGLPVTLYISRIQLSDQPGKVKAVFNEQMKNIYIRNLIRLEKSVCDAASMKGIDLSLRTKNLTCVNTLNEKQPNIVPYIVPGHGILYIKERS